MSDLERVRLVLEGVERDATELRWAEERPWKTSTHTWLEGAMVVVDLHDLNARLGGAAARAVCEVAETLSAGAVLFVVGVGRRSAGPPVLQRVVVKALADSPWRVRMAAHGRVALIVDASVAPAAATGAMGWGMTLWWLFVMGAALLALGRGCLS